jgi:hypothetical protein
VTLFRSGFCLLGVLAPLGKGAATDSEAPLPAIFDGDGIGA